MTTHIFATSAATFSSTQKFASTSQRTGEALEMIRHRRYGAIILDLMMPVVNGFEVLQEIKTLHPWLLKRTIVATAASEATLKTFSDSMQIAALLRKPFDIGELRSAVLQCLEAGD